MSVRASFWPDFDAGRVRCVHDGAGGRTVDLCLFGAPLDTGNRGVEALGRAALDGLARGAGPTAVTLFDNGFGVRPGPADVPGVAVELCGVRSSRRVHLRESWWNVRASQRLGGLGNPVLARIARASAALDLSGGDSFSDLYGARRFVQVLEPKLATLRARRPLILLPQTYGPFKDKANRLRAAAALQGAAGAWARDGDSFDVMLDLLGEHVDPRRHRRGVDVAFGLTPRSPQDPDHQVLVDRLLTDRSSPVAGVNVSGLLWGQGRHAGMPLKVDYITLHLSLVRGLVDRGARVLLVPHVRDVAHDRESDLAASRELIGLLPEEVSRRVTLAPDDVDARAAKWLISRCDWFCGTRMHATIAALSTATPAAAVAYSMKTRGVFGTCGLADEVVEARHIGTAEALERLLDAFDRRLEVRRCLTLSAPAVVAAAQDQMDDVLDLVRQIERASGRAA